MSILGDSHLGSISVFLQSDKADESISDSHKIWYLEELIDTEPHLNMLIALTSFELAYSFYNINKHNNTFEISANGNTINFTIESKNYTAQQLATELTSQLALRTASLGQTIILSYNTQELKFDFSSDQLNIPYTITTNTTMTRELGLILPLVSSSGKITSNKIANLSGTSSIYFKINNLGIRNRDSRGKTDGNIQKINVNSNFGEYIFYDSTESIYYPLTNRTITKIEASLTDMNSNELIMNGGDFSFTLTIHFQKVRENIIPRRFLLDMLKMELQDEEKNENVKSEK